jgi:hypothetical protein
LWAWEADRAGVVLWAWEADWATDGQMILGQNFGKTKIKKFGLENLVGRDAAEK